MRGMIKGNILFCLINLGVNSCVLTRNYDFQVLIGHRVSFYQLFQISVPVNSQKESISNPLDLLLKSGGSRFILVCLIATLYAG